MSTPDEQSPASVDDARRFALSEDWLATMVGLTIVLLTAAGVITEGWLPLRERPPPPATPAAPSRTPSSATDAACAPWASCSAFSSCSQGGVATRLLTENVPVWAEGSAFADFAEAIEYPVYAIILGLGLNALLSATGPRERLALGFRTESFITTGLVVLSAPAVSICGVSAAIAAAGAVRAKREQLACTASLVILFALPSIFVLPWLAGVLGLSDAVTGAWLGGNIDTTAAVTAAGTIAGEDALQIASVVKLTQNALIGFVAVGLTAWFAFEVERAEGSDKPKAIELWHRFPKFVIGFVAASVIATIHLEGASAETLESFDTVVKGLRDYFLILAFVSIGLEFTVTSLKEAVLRPVELFAVATLFNIVLALGLASLLFAGCTA